LEVLHYEKDSKQEQNILEIKLPENAADIFRQVIEFFAVIYANNLSEKACGNYPLWHRDARQGCRGTGWPVRKKHVDPEKTAAFKKNGIKWLKCSSLPAKADTEKQKTFFDTILNLLMKKAEGGEISLLSLDASHFVMGCGFLGRIYGRGGVMSGHFPDAGATMSLAHWTMSPKKCLLLQMTAT